MSRLLNRLPMPHPFIPTLETPRLRMREHRREDYGNSLRMWSNPDVTRFIVGGRPSTGQEVWTRLLRYVGHWAVMGFGYWLVEEKETGLFVGDVGLANFKRDMEPSFGDTPEIGWVLSPDVHGKGYATEAVRAALAWSDAHLDASETVCMIEDGNDSSMNVARKCGYGEFRRANHNGQPMVHFSRPRGLIL